MENKRKYIAPQTCGIALKGLQLMITTSVPTDDNPNPGTVDSKRDYWDDEDEDDAFDDNPSFVGNDLWK